VRGGKAKDPNTVVLEKRVSDALGLAVSIDHRDPGGTVHIRYRELEQLDDIMRRLDKGSYISLARRIIRSPDEAKRNPGNANSDE
jgi:hypothetical protein